MSDPTPTTGKLARSAHLFYINVNFNTTLNSAEWYLVGKDVTDMSIELNPDTEVIKNILDETSVQDNGYQPSISVDTYYADPDGSTSSTKGKFYAKMKDIAFNRKKGDACKTLVLEIVIDMTGVPYSAWVEDAIIKPQSYGGAQGGVRIPYNVQFDGNRQVGTVTAFTDKNTFTLGTFTAV